jgi:hypothetical protein
MRSRLKIRLKSLRVKLLNKLRRFRKNLLMTKPYKLMLNLIFKKMFKSNLSRLKTSLLLKL